MLFIAQCKDSGNIHRAQVGKKTHLSISLGYLENRDARFSPFATKNFGDLLQIQLINLHYKVLDLDYSPLSRSQPGSVHRSNKSENQTHRPVDDTRNLLPVNLRNAAGEIHPVRFKPAPGQRLLTRKEIAHLSSQNQFQFFLQGAIGRSETGLLLDIAENTLIILFIYNTSGEKIGAINFTAEKRNLSNYEFMHNVAERLAKTVQSIIATYVRQL